VEEDHPQDTEPFQIASQKCEEILPQDPQPISASEAAMPTEEMAATQPAAINQTCEAAAPNQEVAETPIDSCDPVPATIKEDSLDESGQEDTED
jgi:hypothetical protein